MQKCISILCLFLLVGCGNSTGGPEGKIVRYASGYEEYTQKEKEVWDFMVECAEYYGLDTSSGVEAPSVTVSEDGCSGFGTACTMNPFAIGIDEATWNNKTYFVWAHEFVHVLLHQILNKGDGGHQSIFFAEVGGNPWDGKCDVETNLPFGFNQCINRVRQIFQVGDDKYRDMSFIARASEADPQLCPPGSFDDVPEIEPGQIF